MSTTEARAALPELLDRVEAGEEVTITRHGRPVAVVVRPDTLRARRAADALKAAERVREALSGAAGSRLGAAGALSDRSAEDLIDEVRAGRERR